jgi:hypothetical protein
LRGLDRGTRAAPSGRERRQRSYRHSYSDGCARHPLESGS